MDDSAGGRASALTACSVFSIPGMGTARVVAVGTPTPRPPFRSPSRPSPPFPPSRLLFLFVLTLLL